MNAKRLLMVAALLLAVIVSSCSKSDTDSNDIDIVGTEWSYTDIDSTIGLKFYANNAVTSFVDNQYGIATISGTYEYIKSSKMLTFKGLVWYYAETGNVAMTMTGAHIIDKNKMEVVMQLPDGSVDKDYLYRK